MQTGYTSIIKDDVSFKTFAMSCARAFLIRMKDRMGEIPEEFEVYKYHLKEFRKTQDEYDDFIGLNEGKKKIIFDKERKEHEDLYRRRKKDAVELTAKYVSMLEKVKAWSPPTEKHEEFKKFMISQIESSIDFDCHFHKANPFDDFKTWVEKKEESLERSIMYHAEEYQKEKKRVKEMNKWIKDLRDSL